MSDITGEAVPSVNAVARVRGVDAGAATLPAPEQDARDLRIAQLAEELANTPEAIRKRRFEKRFAAGRLTLADYKTLPKPIQQMYAKLHGVPLAESEIQRQENYKQNRKEKNKCAKKSRQRNRR
jgi:hypothetical protein